jgi:hypothetical protein
MLNASILISSSTDGVPLVDDRKKERKQMKDKYRRDTFLLIFIECFH